MMPAVTTRAKWRAMQAWTSPTNAEQCAIVQLAMAVEFGFCCVRCRRPIHAREMFDTDYWFRCGCDEFSLKGRLLEQLRGVA